MDAANTIPFIFMAVGILSLAAAIVIAVMTYYRRKKALLRMRQMLDAAINGTFTANSFDESLYSAVENKLSEYLNASEISARRTAEEKDRIKALIADISHQTKTPISNILIYTELLKEQKLPDEAVQSVMLLESQAQKLHFLIASLVKLSRLETGIIVMHPREDMVSGLLEETYKQFCQKAEEKGLYLQMEMQDAVHITAVFDEKWTGEALGNIIDNAIKYTKSGGVTVTVKPYELFVGIEVADTGIGITEEDQPKIFGRFYRSMDVNAEEGVGIGLYLARQILQMEGGYIKVMSEAGKGSKFTLYLQRARQGKTKIAATIHSSDG